MTLRQRLILLAIAYQRARLGWPPTVRDLLHSTDLSSKGSLAHQLGQLREMGLVDWKTGASRTLHLTAAGKEMVG